MPDEQTLEAMRWASKLNDDQNVLSLIRSLPKGIIDEQVRLYENRGKTETTSEKPKLVVSACPTLRTKMLVAQRFHTFCVSRGFDPRARMPRGALTQFIETNLLWKSAALGKGALTSVRKWHTCWSKSPASMLAAVAEPSATAGI